jgi:hypothetical protein
VLHFHGQSGIAVDLRFPISAHVRDQLLALELSGGFAIVTAFNPYGVDVADQENRRRHAALQDELDSAGVRHAPVTGASPDGMHCEEGCAVWMSCEGARNLAARYDQTAFFWFDEQDFWVVPTVVDVPPVRLPAV